MFIFAGTSGINRRTGSRNGCVTSVKQLLAAAKDLKQPFTCQTQQVFSGDVVTAAGSRINGLIGALVKEQPQWSISRIDLELSDDPQMPVEPDWSTLFAAAIKKMVTCLRAHHYYRQQLCPLVYRR
ncbi:hypothetical protein CS542_08020 [Pedobacter sp. IW39]|nr:hypothetical protein CS542_08020 [Pedobacter sp. IW39]